MRKCVKCESTDIAVQFVEKDTKFKDSMSSKLHGFKTRSYREDIYWIENKEELLQCSCKACKYLWFTHTADNTNDK